MQYRLQLLTPLFLALAAGGCGSVGTTLDGRSITGTSACFSYAGLQSDPQQASVTLGGKTVTVTPTEVTWAGGGSLALPPSWSRVQLSESSAFIVVTVDGSKLAIIRPAS